MDATILYMAAAIAGPVDCIGVVSGCGVTGCPSVACGDSSPLRQGAFEMVNSENIASPPQCPKGLASRRGNNRPQRTCFAAKRGIGLPNTYFPTF